MSASPSGSSLEPPAPAPVQRAYSRAGLIVAALLTAWCLLGLVVGKEGSGASFFACFVANAALAARSFRPPLRFWQGLVTWFGGMIAGTAVEAFKVGPLAAKLLLFLFMVALGAALIWAALPRSRKSP